LKTVQHLLAPAPGIAHGLGLYLAGMEEVRQQLSLAVAGMSDRDVGILAMPGAHSVGALVLHIGEAEWWWMQCIVAGHEPTDEDSRAPFWDVLESPETFAGRGYSAEFCLQEVGRIRRQTRQLLASFDDRDLDRTFAQDRNGVPHLFSLRWILHHLIDHEAQHKGQILMLKRFMGLSNPDPIAEG
jgi:uncharacterized damage-inducible protein DinB